MSTLSRRDFIRGSMAAGAGIAMAAPFSRARGANDAVRLAVVGVGSQGSGHCKYFSAIDGVRLVAVCDPDQGHIDRRVEGFKKNGQTVKGFVDVRELLEDKGIDAITSATVAKKLRLRQ